LIYLTSSWFLGLWLQASPVLSRFSLKDKRVIRWTDKFSWMSITPGSTRAQEDAGHRIGKARLASLLSPAASAFGNRCFLALFRFRGPVLVFRRECQISPSPSFVPSCACYIRLFPGKAQPPWATKLVRSCGCKACVSVTWRWVCTQSCHLYSVVVLS
jgi:hypothetical protein